MSWAGRRVQMMGAYLGVCRPPEPLARPGPPKSLAYRVSVALVICSVFGLVDGLLHSGDLRHRVFEGVSFGAWTLPVQLWIAWSRRRLKRS